ncbi:cobyrinate a,c-diamide synthase [Thalassobaculum sp.]|uniref:cobyrinate a,c-diamide synthase n=1 Tax=Thalassobaculum sp. TaxID=2022740 RepID=UPI0032EF5408
MTAPLPAPGLIVAAPSSGAGKTTVATALMAGFARRGLRVAPAKVGPDYIDPRFHEAAAGRTSVNLDGWAMRPDLLDGLVAARGSQADLVVVEGVMGLFDGAPAAGAVDDGSTAALARRTGWPVLLVVDAARQAGSVAALVHGFRSFDPAVPVAGVLLNRVGGDRHAGLLRRALDPLGLPVVGAIPRDAAVDRPSRHLGLVQAGEDPALGDWLDRLAALADAHVDLDAVRALARPAGPATGGTGSLPPLGARIAVARDDAFGFLYPHQLDGWRAAGSDLSFFSPLADQAPDPAADAVFLPGGYPELHAGRLAAAERFRHGLQAAAGRDAWIYGECGGFMALGEALVDADGGSHRMAGLLPLTTRFDARRLHLGYRLVTTRAGTPFGPAGTRLRGHEFHYSSIGREGAADRPFEAEDALGNGVGETGLRRGRILGSYMHLIDSDRTGMPENGTEREN